MIYVLCFLGGAIVMALVLVLAYQRRGVGMREDLARKSSVIAARDTEIERLQAEIGKTDARHDLDMEEAKAQYQENLSALREEFRRERELIQEQMRTATQTLLEQREQSLNENNRKQIEPLLQTLQERVGEMRQSMDTNRESFTREAAALREKINMINENSSRLSEEAGRLSKALASGPKIQGDFGEMKLKDLLDSFGFQQGLEYDVQYVMRNAKGSVIRNDESDKQMRPDAVLHYPDHHDVIIDAKASFTAYINYVNTDDLVEKETFLKDHIKSVKQHVDELASKSYSNYSIQGGVTLDFVVMFIPHESALQLALLGDPGLFEYAFRKKVMMCGPQNLYALLRLLEIAWRQQKQTESEQEVFRLADELMSRIGQFAERFDNVKKALDNASERYDDAVKSLSGQRGILSSAGKLKKLGAKEDAKHPLTNKNS